MFINVAKEFIQLMNGEEKISCDLESGINVMRIIEAARISNKEMRFIKMDEIP